MASARARHTGLQLHDLFLGFIVILYALNEALIRGRNASAKKMQMQVRGRPLPQSAQHWGDVYVYCSHTAQYRLRINGGTVK